MPLRGNTLLEMWSDLKSLLVRDKADRLDIEDFELALAEANGGIGMTAEEALADMREAEEDLDRAEARWDRLRDLLT